MLMLPEIIVIVTAFLVMFADLSKRATGPLALFGLFASLGSVIYLSAANTGPMEILGGRFAVDAVAAAFKFFFLLCAIMTVALSLDALDGTAKCAASRLGNRGEYYTIMLLNISGMMFMASSRDMVSLYVSLELATIPLFILTAWRRDALSMEGALKYVLTGALASALLLYGLGLLYGLTGQTDLSLIGKLLKPSPLLWLAAAFLTAGIGFKLALAPFHMWAPDAYQGAPTPVTAYLSVASKGAGLLLAFQLFFRVFGQFLHEWGYVIAVLAAITMTLGNCVAIVQQNVKRFMAYSAISQAGYLVMGFLHPSHESVAAMLFYMLVYAVTNLTAFAVIMFYSNETGAERIVEYRGLARTNPLIALAMMVSLFSLAGIPPLSGFTGKFFLFSVAAKSGFYWLVALAAINSTVSLYYYLRMVRQMYIEEGPEKTGTIPASRVLGTTIALGAAATVLLGIVPMFYERIHATSAGWLEGIIKSTNMGLR